MGALDDAIREHLELKRRHGATEEEIARKEAEALGPARRGPAAEPAMEPAPGSPEDLPPEAVDPDGLVEPEAVELAEPDAAEPEPVEPQEPVAPLAETEPVGADEEPLATPVEPTIDVPSEPEPPAALDPAPADPIEADLPPVHDVDRDPLEPPPPVTKAAPGATVEFDTLSARRDDDDLADPTDEDVLEETPEFLRETPEHDRLWFEQKPPRDFDLDN
ncbi:MAG TPA: hypothetical protein VF517_11470 [Thermoleophilaceae bacterium]|jgi:hypothetical protein